MAVSPTVRIDVSGARGKSEADILRATGAYGVLPTDDDLTAELKKNAVAIAASESAAASAALAESASGPTYASVAAGEAATTVGHSFAVSNGDGTVTVYLRTSGGSTAQRTLATTAALASTDPAKPGAGIIGYIAAADGAIGRTLQDKGRDSLSVADFGIKGNSLLNERSLLIAAMSAAAALGMPLDLLGMTIHAEGAAIPCNCSINGAGATIYGRLEAVSSNLHWKDITVRSESAVYAIYLHGRSDGRCKNIHLENVRTGFESPSTPGNRLGLSATYIDELKITGGYYEYGANLVNWTPRRTV